MYEPIPTAAAERLFTAIEAFRERLDDAPSLEVCADLLALFPAVDVRAGYRLDYVQDTTPAGEQLSVRPFVRPVDEADWLPLLDAGREDRQAEVELLYQYFEFPRTRWGLFEYSLCLAELWALHAGHAGEWPASTPIFGAAAFDAAVAASGVGDVQRPGDCRAQASVDESGGGCVRLLVHTEIGRARIYYLESTVASDGFVERRAGELVADLGMGLMF